MHKQSIPYLRKKHLEETFNNIILISLLYYDVGVYGLQSKVKWLHIMHQRGIIIINLI